MKNTNKTKILFVGGYGRSGSTILDVLLDRVPGIVAVGEFRHLFGRALGDNELCSCGKPFRDCAFWSNVINKAFPNGYDRKQIDQAIKSFNTVRRLPQLLWPSLRSSKLKRQAEIYSAAFSAVYRAVAEETGASVVVDSSKYPMHGLFLRTVDNIDMKTMLLARDPRAVAYSWERHRIRPEVHWEKREMPRHNVIRSALAWNVSNWLTRLIGGGKHKLRIQRYEDFTDKPLDTLQEIAAFALGKKVKLTDDIFNKQIRTPHTIAGNPVRIGSKQVKVHDDNEWAKNMPGSKKVAVSAFCAPQMLKLGYKLET